MYPRLLLVGAFVLVAAAVPDASRPQLPVPLEFQDRVNAYVDMHQAIAATFPPETVAADPAQLIARRRAFAAAVRNARPDAAPGNIFTPDVAEYFLRQIEAVAREAGADRWAALLESQRDEVEFDDTSLTVNGDVPWAAGPSICASVLWRLPGLPPELEYRFVGSDLLLIDVRAGLIVDLLKDALPLTGTAERPRSVTPCDVHPDLPACWS
jgi:hypothetical protein